MALVVTYVILHVQHFGTSLTSITIIIITHNTNYLHKFHITLHNANVETVQRVKLSEQN